MARIKVLVGDDHGLIRTGLRSLIDLEPDMLVVGEVDNGMDALAEAARLRSDVALLSAELPCPGGVEVTSLLPRSPATAKVVLLAERVVDEHVVEAVRVGVSGYLLKCGPPRDVVAAVRAVAAGHAILAPPVTRVVLDRVMRTSTVLTMARSGSAEPLSARELEVLMLLAQGLSNLEIAKSLGCSEGTVKSHVSRLLDKLGLRDRLQAAVFAYQSGLVALAGPSP
jgi:DNA-binding NarL/FixJ family response regulator